MNDQPHPAQYGTAASRWAGVGPYYAMFPINFATSVVKRYTRPGDCVFDPFAGRATSLFAAATEGRYGVGIEINPVGWVYGKAKLQTADRESVERRIHELGARGHYYRRQADKLPPFFHACFCSEVRRFLLAARAFLDWRRQKTDWTTMALLLVDLHGKRDSAFSNQMRQTKAMSPQYAIDWWREQRLKPPDRDPVAFMLKKIAWRYAKGRLTGGTGHLYLGDSQSVLARGSLFSEKASLLLTSPPYYGITNYFYDQWLRLWLLGGPARPQSPGQSCKRKFENKKEYVAMLRRVFTGSSPLLKRGAVIYVRTDVRQFTREATIEALETAFPRKKLREEVHSLPEFTQTALFDVEAEARAEVDLIMW